MEMFLISGKIPFDSLSSPGDKFQLLDVIGEGTYGEVYAAIDLEIELKDANERSRDSKVAIKILENLPENLEEAEVELMVLRDYSIHPNIPSFYGLYFKRASRPEDCQLWYVMELCSGGSATDLAQGLRKFEGRRLTEIQIAYILREVVDALIHLHTHHCIHRDIKGHNILLTGDGRVKLIDFGVTAHLKDTYARRNTSIGTPYWMAPEVIACEHQKDSSYDCRCDIWSLGVTSIELAEGEPPLADLHPMRALFQIPRNPPPTLTKSHEWSRDFNDFVAECLIKDFKHRPFMVELRQHPFLHQLSSIPEDIIRQELIQDIHQIKANGDLVKREPEVTTKHGKLKTGRKARLQTMFVDDLAAFSVLDEETIVDQLFHRFQRKQPYTYIGDILIAMNPYNDIRIYNEFYQFKYRAATTADVAPHIFAVADQAYHSMLHQKRSQNISITGDSGSGKTESANFLLKHLVYLRKAPNRNLESKILQVSPIIEAFGNAATRINKNSSRFVKYLNVTFTRTGKITGAKISVYLLEESRVDRQSKGQRNFHMFYYLLHGLQSVGRGQEIKLDNKRYNFLHGIGDSIETQKENVHKFEQVNNGFLLLGFRMEEIESIYRILAAILHIGEIRFDACNDEDGCGITNVDELETVANLLGASPVDLGLCLTTCSVVTSEETFIRRNSCAEARTCRNSLARGLYKKLFDWIVYQINALLLGISGLSYGDPLSIGLLDIFGFESFQTNSLEQLYINITNEQLQYLFNQHILNWEQQEHMAEGVNIEVVKYADNGPILELCLGKPFGILSLTDEESRLPRSTDSTLLEKLNANLESNRYYYSHPPKSKGDLSFVIRHYAGKVQYSAKGFLKKNRSTNSSDIIQMLSKSSNDLVKTIYRSLQTKTGDWRKEEELGLASQARSPTTVATNVRVSLMDLMAKVLGAELHFVRCIKPNDVGGPDQFDSATVLRQLRNSGVLETIRIRQLGYSHRFTFAEFLKSYCFLAFNFDERVVANKETCRLLLLRLKLDNWALGKTKVFLKYYHVEYLAKLCEQQIRSVVFVQACVRRWLTKIRVRMGMWKVAKTVVSAQRAANVWMKRKRSENTGSGGPSEIKKKGVSILRARLLGEEIILDDDDDERTTVENLPELKAAILIQSHFRGFRVRKQWGPVLEERIQQIVLKHETRDDAEKALWEEGLNAEEAALVLQRLYRKWKLIREKSEELDSPEEPRLNLDAWDAPFRIMECHEKDRRAGRIRHEKVDLAAYRREMIISGLQSQDLANQEREKIVAGKWQNVINIAGSSDEKRQENEKHNLVRGKFRQQLLDEASTKKVEDARKSSKEKNEQELDIKKALLMNALKPPLLVSVSDESPQDTQQSSIVDFRKNLRKAGHRPTDSLKKGWACKD